MTLKYELGICYEKCKTFIKNVPDKFWTSIELHELHKESRGEENKRSRFLTKLTAHMKNELYVFTLPGLAGIVMLKEKRPQYLKLSPKIKMMMMVMFQCNVLQTRQKKKSK